MGVRLLLDTSADSSRPGHTPTQEASCDAESLVLLRLTEAMNREYEEYGPDRMIDYFRQPGACAASLVERARAFGRGSDTADDATAVLVTSGKVV